MSLARDCAYLLLLLLTSPFWLVDLARSPKHRTGWRARFGHTHLSPADRPTILIHAVSVGEVNAVQALVDELLRRHADQLRIVISTTTNTGLARATALYKSRCEIVRYPWDFSWAVRRFLRQVGPDVVALVELELWPNFIAACKKRNCPVVIVNGRLSDRSFRNYFRARPFIGWMFRSLDHACVQDEAYARRFTAMGVPSDRLTITGTMKWDNATITDHVPGSSELADAMGIDRHRPLIVCGSTGPDEEAMFVRCLSSLTDAQRRAVQVMCVPRKPERFDEAAAQMGQPIRRSTGERAKPGQSLFLLDSMGELKAAYALADVVVIGRSFCGLYGSDMMEPAALGKAIVIGPDTADFQSTMDTLLAYEGIIQVNDGPSLAAAVGRLLTDPAARATLAQGARKAIVASQGASRRTADRLDAHIRAKPPASR